MSWSPGQQAMLAAMGYVLYRQVGAEPPAAAVREPQAGVAAAAPPRLLQALVRAAGGRELAGLALPPLEQLRASGAAKRALWPALRALRRQH
jgi:hypothetical protein